MAELREHHELCKDIERDDVKQGCKLPSRGLIQKQPRGRRITVWSYYYLANVEKAEVCVEALDEACPMEKTGCPRLHATVPWHWQVKNHAGNWCNILVIQAKELERAYQDPAIDKIKVSPMQRKHVTNYGCEIIKLLGKGWCEANFTAMTMKSSDGSQTFELRRLSTPSSSVSDSEHATPYEWFFQDRKKWIPMENSQDIETFYQVESSVFMTFKQNKYEYTLDFESMTRQNLDTEKQTAIRRRPKKRPELQPRELKMRSSRKAKLPPSWEATDNTQVSLLAPLSSGCTEFLEIGKRMADFFHKVKDVEIVRVQNPTLFLPLKNKVTEITKRRKRKPLVLRLFHWPRQDQVDTICRDNFSPRLQHPAITYEYGRGTYFVRSVSRYSDTCGPGKGERGVVFVADVLLDGYVEGDNTMNSPPKIPGSTNTYGTTVDSQHMPTVYVKFSKRDYCPRYVVHFTA